MDSVGGGFEVDVRVERTALDGVLIIEDQVYEDDRGSFSEVFNLDRFQETTGIARSWVQDNQSVSRKGVLRGIHFQNPRPQGKLVRCVVGSLFDVAVDLRRSSDTFRAWVGLELSDTNNKQLWIPEGFGHGFYALSDGAAVLYKTTEYYVPEADRTLRWDDPDIAIEWPLTESPIVSEKDRDAPLLIDADVFE